MSNVTENPQVFKTRQFMAGNSPAVRIPVSMAFAHQTELSVTRVAWSSARRNSGFRVNR